MKKPINKEDHIIVDYTYAAIVPLLPELIGFENSQAAKYTCRILGAGALAYTLFTKAKRTPFSLIPFKAHLFIDVTVSLLAIATPWLSRFARNTDARNTLFGVGLSGLTAGLLTDADKKPATEDLPLFI